MMTDTRAQTLRTSAAASQQLLTLLTSYAAAPSSIPTEHGIVPISNRLTNFVSLGTNVEAAAQTIGTTSMSYAAPPVPEAHTTTIAMLKLRYRRKLAYKQQEINALKLALALALHG